MQFTSKYEPDGLVWGISWEDARRIVKCLTCNHTGKVAIGAEEFVCPKCNGDAEHPKWEGRKWFVYHSGRIGKINVEFQTSGHEIDCSPKVTYMIDATGIGSGTVWNEKDLFPTHEAAESACNQKNSVLLLNEGSVQLMD